MSDPTQEEFEADIGKMINAALAQNKWAVVAPCGCVYVVADESTLCRLAATALLGQLSHANEMDGELPPHGTKLN